MGTDLFSPESRDDKVPAHRGRLGPQQLTVFCLVGLMVGANIETKIVQ